MKFVHSQQGLSLLSGMVGLAMVSLLASATLKMLPHYLDYMSMEKIIASVETDKSADVRSVADFYAHVSKGMTVNSIRDLDLEKVLEVKIEENEFRAHLKYEAREPLIENLDLVARFDKELRVRMP